MYVDLVFEHAHILFQPGFAMAFCFHEYIINVKKPKFSLMKIIYMKLLGTHETYLPVFIYANYTILSIEYLEKEKIGNQYK